MGSLEKFLDRPLKTRQEESAKIREKYPGKLPVIVTKAPSEKNLQECKKIKYLFPGTLTIGQVLYVIRKHVQVSSEVGLYIFVGDSHSLPPVAELVLSIYNQYKSEDGFLYITYSGESTFGSLPRCLPPQHKN